MQMHNYLYSFRYHEYESELCKLESRSFFQKEEIDKLLSSNIKVEPSDSAFIKRRIDIISFAEDYNTLLDQIKNETIYMEDFKVEYIVFEGDPTEYIDRLGKLKDVGNCINGYPDYHNPVVTYALCFYKNIWCFGRLIKNNFDWHKHNEKPCSYSHSISINIAKALVNIASNANKETKLIDICCGVGTIMLEACFAGYNIDGCDINLKICEHARENLLHFNYSALVYHSDIKDINTRYEAGIIDLPYNLYSNVTDENIMNIIESTAHVTNRVVIVSTSDITQFITKAGLVLSDYCDVKKVGKEKFTRKIWVCEKNG